MIYNQKIFIKKGLPLGDFLSTRQQFRYAGFDSEPSQ